MKQIEVSVWIDRPAEDVYAYVVDLVILTDDIGRDGIFKVFLPVLPSLVRSGYRRNLAGLKSALEAQPTQLPDEASE